MTFQLPTQDESFIFPVWHPQIHIFAVTDELQKKRKSVAGPQQVLRYSNSSTVAKVELYSSRHRYLELVRDQDDGLSPQPALDALLKDVLAHVDVHSRERVV